MKSDSIDGESLSDKSNNYFFNIYFNVVAVCKNWWNNCLPCYNQQKEDEKKNNFEEEDEYQEKILFKAQDPKEEDKNKIQTREYTYMAQKEPCKENNNLDPEYQGGGNNIISWIIDSDASCHMTPVAKHITNPEACDVVITIADATEICFVFSIIIYFRF